MTDLSSAFRTLRGSPGFTAAAVVMLALGIGLNAAAFTLTNTVLFKGFRLVNGNDRLLYIGAQKDGRGCCASYPDFLDWKNQATSFADMAAVADLRVTLSDGGSGFTEAYSATQISANGFKLLGRSPMLGRDFAPADERPGAPPVAILTHALWERRFGAAGSIVGRSVRLNGVPTTIIGVMPRGFSFPQNQDVWVPLVPTRSLDRRDNRALWFTVGRLRDGVTRAAAGAELAQIGRRLATAYPETNEGWVPRPLSFSEFFVGPDASTTYGALWAAVAFVLLIASANMANLLLARAASRTREMSVRIAIGAGRTQIVRQLLIESLMLSVMGGVLGWWIARWGVRVYTLSANPPTRSWSDNLLDYTMDGRVLFYAIAVSVVTGLLFGIVPALRLSRLDVTSALKDGARGLTRSGGARRMSTLLVAGEMALAVVLMAAAGVTIRSFFNMATADLGVNPVNTLTMLMNLPPERYPDAEAQQAFYERFTQRLEALPGVESSAVTSFIPAAGARRALYDISGSATADAEHRPTVGVVTIDGAYFRTLGAPVRGGRDFSNFDGPSGVPVAIVNDRFARTHWPGESPLGKRLRLFDGDDSTAWRTVVGVAPDIVQEVTRQVAEPLVYLPFRQRPVKDAWVLVHASVPPAALSRSVQREVAAIDPDLPIWLGPFTLEDRLAGMGNYWNTGNDATLLLMFAGLALLLASGGLYSLVSHSVSQRRHEIGVRLAIGATTRDVLTLICSQGLRPVAIGLVVGLAVSLGANRALKSLLVDVSSNDPLTLALAGVVLVCCAALGCLLPAMRATRVDPVAVLKA